MVLFFNKQYKNEIFAGYSHLYDPLTGRWPFLAGPERSYGACVDLLVEEFLPNTLWMLKISAFFCAIFHPCPLAAGAFFVV